MEIVAIESTSTLGNLEEVINTKVSGGNTHGELEVITVASDLHDFEPQEFNLDANTFQFSQLAFGDNALDGGLVLEVVGFNAEDAGSVKIDGELAGLFV